MKHKISSSQRLPKSNGYYIHTSSDEEKDESFKNETTTSKKQLSTFQFQHTSEQYKDEGDQIFYNNNKPVTVVSRLRSYPFSNTSLSNYNKLKAPLSPTLHHIFTYNNNPDKTNTSTDKSQQQQRQTLIISPEALNERLLFSSIKTEQDLLNINNTFLTKAKAYKYDNIYNGKNGIKQLYMTEIREKIKKMFNGYSSAMFLIGPNKSGKTFTLFGGNEPTYGNNNNTTTYEKGIIHYCLDELLSLISISKQSNASYYGISSTYSISLTIYNIYIKKVDLLHEEVVINSINDFNMLLKQIPNLRKELMERTRVTEMPNKSHFIIVLSLYQMNKNNSTTDIENNNKVYVQCLSKYVFVELNDSSYGFAPSNAPTTKLYANTAKTYEDLRNCCVSLSSNIQPKAKTALMKFLCEENEGKGINVLTCGTAVTLVVCLAPCDYHVQKYKNVVIWSNCLLSKLSKGIEGEIRGNVIINDDEKEKKELKEENEKLKSEIEELRKSNRKSTESKESKEGVNKIMKISITDRKKEKKINEKYNELKNKYEALEQRYQYNVEQMNEMKKTYDNKIVELEEKIEFLTEMVSNVVSKQDKKIKKDVTTNEDNNIENIDQDKENENNNEDEQQYGQEEINQEEYLNENEEYEDNKNDNENEEYEDNKEECIEEVDDNNEEV